METPARESAPGRTWLGQPRLLVSFWLVIALTLSCDLLSWSFARNQWLFGEGSPLGGVGVALLAQTTGWTLVLGRMAAIASLVLGIIVLLRRERASLTTQAAAAPSATPPPLVTARQRWAVLAGIVVVCGLGIGLPVVLFCRTPQSVAMESPGVQTRAAMGILCKTGDLPWEDAQAIMGPPDASYQGQDGSAYLYLDPSRTGSDDTAIFVEVVSGKVTTFGYIGRDSPDILKARGWRLSPKAGAEGIGVAAPEATAGEEGRDPTH